MRRKYHNRKVNGFDSQKEMMRFAQLQELERTGQISNLQRQVVFELIPRQTEMVERTGKKGQKIKPKEIVLERACKYKADFTYYENGRFIVEDCKGFKTPEYKIKRKLMLTKGFKIRET